MPRTHTTDDGADAALHGHRRSSGTTRRGCRSTHTRYERERDGEVEVLERDWVLHWYTQDGFRQLASDAGLLVDEVLGARRRAAAPDATSFTFVVSRDPAFDRTASVRDRLPPAGRALAAGMLGLDEAIYGEKPKVEIVAEADADGLDLGDVDLDMDDPRLPHDDRPDRTASTAGTSDRTLGTRRRSGAHRSRRLERSSPSEAPRCRRSLVGDGRPLRLGCRGRLP